MCSSVWSNCTRVSHALKYHWPSFPPSHPGQDHCRDTSTNNPQSGDTSCLLFWLLGTSSPDAFICASALGQKHTHTQTHINTGDTSPHVYIYTHARHRDTNANREHSFLSSWRCPCPAMWEMASVGTMSFPWGPLSTSSHSSSVFSQASLKPVPAQPAWWWNSEWWMWKYTDDPKVSTQVHWEPREDALLVIGYPRSSGGGEGPITILWDWNENWPFPVLWPWLSFPNLLAYWVQHFMI